MMDPDIDQKAMIKAVEERPLLWDKSALNYKNRSASRIAWTEISSQLIPGFESLDEKNQQNFTKRIVYKWTHIRDNYSRYINSPENRKPYIHVKNLQFLAKVIKPKKAANISIDEGSTSKTNSKEMSETDASTEADLSNDSSDLSTSKSKDNKTMKSSEQTDKSTGLQSHTYRPLKSEISRHLSFFQSILPTVEHFDDNEVLEFQMGILQLLKKIKSSRSTLPAVSNSTISVNQCDSYFEIFKQEN